MLLTHTSAKRRGRRRSRKLITGKYACPAAFINFKKRDYLYYRRRIRHKRRQRSSLLFGEHTWMPFGSKDDLKKGFWKNIHFVRVVVCCCRMRWSSIFPKHSTRQVYIRSSIHNFFQIILVLNLECGMELNKFCPPASSDDLCLLFCLILLQWSLLISGYVPRARLEAEWRRQQREEEERLRKNPEVEGVLIQF